MTASAPSEVAFSAARGCLVQIGSALPENHECVLQSRVQVRSAQTRALLRLRGMATVSECRPNGNNLQAAQKSRPVEKESEKLGTQSGAVVKGPGMAHIAKFDLGTSAVAVCCSPGGHEHEKREHNQHHLHNRHLSEHMYLPCSNG
jgi:hypothetical protein